MRCYNTPGILCTVCGRSHDSDRYVPFDKSRVLYRGVLTGTSLGTQKHPAGPALRRACSTPTLPDTDNTGHFLPKESLWPLLNRRLAQALDSLQACDADYDRRYGDILKANQYKSAIPWFGGRPLLRAKRSGRSNKVLDYRQQSHRRESSGRSRQVHPQRSVLRHTSGPGAL